MDFVTVGVPPVPSITTEYVPAVEEVKEQVDCTKVIVADNATVVHEAVRAVDGEPPEVTVAANIIVPLKPEIAVTFSSSVDDPATTVNI